MQHKDMRLLSDKKKYETYDKIGTKARGVKVEEHSSGFPAITVDYRDFHLLTDCLSVEEWWKERQNKPLIKEGKKR